MSCVRRTVMRLAENALVYLSNARLTIDDADCSFRFRERLPRLIRTIVRRSSTMISPVLVEVDGRFDTQQQLSTVTQFQQLLTALSCRVASAQAAQTQVSAPSGPRSPWLTTTRQSCFGLSNSCCHLVGGASAPHSQQQREVARMVLHLANPRPVPTCCLNLRSAYRCSLSPACAFYKRPSIGRVVECSGDARSASRRACNVPPFLV
jgi:hypothetical protein